MNKKAIIKINSRQFLVEEGKDYSVLKLDAQVGDIFDKAEVLAVSLGDEYLFGSPTLDKAKVKLEIVDQYKGKKVVQRIYKAKSRYRRTRGHRPLMTKFKVLSIEV